MTDILVTVAIWF